MIDLTHQKCSLWTESGILDELIDKDGNPKPLDQILIEVAKYAKTRAVSVTGCTKKNATKEEEYRNTIGWMGEVLCEFWLKMFGGRYDIHTIGDTSQNQYQRGYDFTGMSVFGSFSALIQIKMQGKPSAFEFKKLFTFFDEAERAGSLPQYTILMVPTSNFSEKDILSYKLDFKQDYLSKMRYIGKQRMNEDIWSLPSSRKFQGTREFFTQFKESIDANFLSSACIIPPSML